jgi:CDP-paratose 2-epimerase
MITGGAGFVGSALAMLFKEVHPSWLVVAFDNLRRRGSELNFAKFKPLGIEFADGDIRQSSDLEDLPGNFDLMVEASAEPSVLAGLDGSPNYVLQTNPIGTLNCLEFARRRTPQIQALHRRNQVLSGLLGKLVGGRCGSCAGYGGASVGNVQLHSLPLVLPTNIAEDFLEILLPNALRRAVGDNTEGSFLCR